jgi:hypothetical protein
MTIEKDPHPPDTHMCRAHEIVGLNFEVFDGRIWFYDETKNIAGSIEYSDPWPFPDGSHVRNDLLRAYGAGLYRIEPIPMTGQARVRDGHRR